MQPNQPDFNPNQPVTPPQPQPVEPQFGAPAPQPYEALVAAPVASFEPLPEQPIEAPVETFGQAPVPTTPTEITFGAAPEAPVAPIVPATPVSLSPAPVLVTKKSHKLLIIILVAIIALVIVVGGVYVAFTMSGNSL